VVKCLCPPNIVDQDTFTFYLNYFRWSPTMHNLIRIFRVKLIATHYCKLWIYMLERRLLRLCLFWFTADGLISSYWALKLGINPRIFSTARSATHNSICHHEMAEKLRYCYSQLLTINLAQKG
jgi:hypothetical protein